MKVFEYLSAKQWLGITVVYAALLLYVSVQPPGQGDGPPQAWRMILHNLCHIPAYGILTFLLIVTFYRHGWLQGIFVKSFIFSTAYGIFNEINQTLVPGREASASDVLLDMIGSAVVLWIVRMTCMKEKRDAQRHLPLS